ncbi:MAG: lipopolysaccharide transport periplasmic protein LptA [Rhodocyclaceae bacterium]|nr:lipopolysaccharide transport periplasmic protein LptA [Rhodocyclaceae bacterium]
MNAGIHLVAAMLVALAAVPAHAERADSEQPVSIEANRGSIDNRNNVHVFEGNVVLSQGSLTIRCDKLVVTQDADGFQRGVASGGDGGRASIRQRREARADFVEGRADRIEYDARTKKATLIGRAEVTSGGDEVRGQYIEYDGLSETYLVTNSKSANSRDNGGRVRAIIQPREAPPVEQKP